MRQAGLMCRLDVVAGSTVLRDQLAWDVNNPEADPDAVAQTMCQDLGLDGDFTPLVAWHIRAQVLPESMCIQPSYLTGSCEECRCIVQVNNIRRMPAEGTLPRVDAAPVDGQQQPARRSKRRATKPQADTGFITTHSSGISHRC